MNDKKKFFNTSKDINNDEKKVKLSMDQDDTLKDLKESFKIALEDTSDIFNNAIEALESALKDPEIRKESVEIVNNLYSEFKTTTEQTNNKILNYYAKNSPDTEEE
jgi:hypothetical protein